jgi:hypothetical protein
MSLGAKSVVAWAVGTDFAVEATLKIVSRCAGSPNDGLRSLGKTDGFCSLTSFVEAI